MSFFESDEEIDYEDNEEIVEEKIEGIVNENDDQEFKSLNVEDKIINEIMFDSWHEMTDCAEMSLDDREIALKEVIENMICYVMKNDGAHCYPYTFREHLEKIETINVIDQLNTKITLAEKIKIIQKHTGHSPELISNTVFQAWNPTRRDKYLPTKVGMRTKLCNTHLLDQIT